jgi:hypothetical protein
MSLPGQADCIPMRTAAVRSLMTTDDRDDQGMRGFGPVTRGPRDMETLPHGQALSCRCRRSTTFVIQQGQSRDRAGTEQGQRQQYATLQFGHHRGRAATDHATAGAYSVNPEKGLAEESISHGSVKMCL